MNLKKFRKFIPVLIVLVVSLSLVYAVTQLNVPGTGTISTTASNWQGITFNPGSVPANALACPTTGYTDTPVAISWGAAVPAGGSVTAGICVKNISTSAHTYTATTTLTVAPTSGTVTITGETADTQTSPGNSVTSLSIVASGISLFTVTVTVSTGASGTFSTNTVIA